MRALLIAIVVALAMPAHAGKSESGGVRLRETPTAKKPAAKKQARTVAKSKRTVKKKSMKPTKSSKKSTKSKKKSKSDDTVKVIEDTPTKRPLP